MNKYSLKGTYQFGENRLKFSTVVEADTWEQAIELVKKQFSNAEVTEVHYMGEAKK